MTNPKVSISQEDYQAFTQFYFGNRQNPEYKGLRFGQAFFYYFRNRGMDKVTDAELFYEPTVEKAIPLIFERYVKCDNS